MSLALYRKYRPATLDEVIGQDHVVEPLKRALDNDRVHHAYLFSGPRGCGKTSSARILARSLNCETGPTSTPCGTCNSCVDLAPNGPGSIDVIELDAATHGLVDDARDLREKAVYAPAASRYKIYIIDEAHQLGPGAANALLKLVEEPPPHLRFVFATTEPDKIIGTIRSRTHHYGFRLVPNRTLQAHLADICQREGFQADTGALSLVSRAAGGSVRDSLSILGQLLAGSGPEGLTYEQAAEQLGVTDSALLDQIVTAMADRDGAAMFRLIDQVVESGHDPRRFVTDLLERLRDLLVISGVPDAAEAGLIEGPADRLTELREQASRFGAGELSRDADLVSAGLSEIKGATAPRLQLELLAARLVLPSADPSDLGARLAAVEAALNERPQVTVAPDPTPAPAAAQPTAAAKVAEPPKRLSDIAPTTRPTSPQPVPRAAEPEATSTAIPPVEASGNVSLDQVRKLWPSMLEQIRADSKVVWMLLVDAHPLSVEGDVIVASHDNVGTVKRFGQSTSYEDKVKAATTAVFAVPLRVSLIHGAGSPTAAASPTASSTQEVDVEVDLAGSTDVDEIHGVALLERELGGVRIGEYDES